MTDTTANAPKMPLGVGTIISESFSILFGNFFTVLILGFVAGFAGFLINGMIIGFEAALGVPDPDAFVIGTIVSSVIGIIIYAIIVAMFVQLAYNAKLGRKGSLGEYFSAALGPLFAVAVLSIVVSLLTAVGMIALIVGGLWIYAVFYVFVPAAVIEKTGFGSLGRSAGLTKGYRWPIVGLFIVMMIILMFVFGILGALLVGVIVATSASTGALIGLGAVNAALTGLFYGLSAISVALVYARLREIKEGVAVDQIAAVFE